MDYTLLLSNAYPATWVLALLALTDVNFAKKISILIKAKTNVCHVMKDTILSLDL
jgi:hypothetical protein